MKAWWLLGFGLVACSGQATIDGFDEDPDADSDGAVVDTDGSTPGDGPDDTDDAPGTDTDPTTPGETDADTPPTSTAMPTDPCGTNLRVDNGEVFPAYGNGGLGGPIGDVRDEGFFEVVSRSDTVANPRNGRQAIEITTFAPSSNGNTADPGPFPVVLFMPGFGTNTNLYGALTETVASHGYQVVAINLPNTGFTDAPRHDLNAEEAIVALDFALGQSPWASRADGTRVAATGHSQGGKIAFYAASLDDRIDIVVGYDPQNGGGPPCAIGGIGGGDCNAFPVAPNCEANDAGVLHEMHAESLVFAAEDGLLTPDAHLRARAFFRGAPSPAHLVRMPNAGHAAWVNGGSDATIVSRATTLALLGDRFHNRTGAARYLPGGNYLANQDVVSQSLSK